MLTNEQVDELVRQVPFGREPYITFRAVFRAGMMEAARIAQDAECKLDDANKQIAVLRSPARRGSDDVDDEAERLFWCFAAMLDPSQTGNAPLSQRDAFKRAIRPSLCAATKEVNDSLRAQLAERTRELAEARALLKSSEHLLFQQPKELIARAESAERQVEKMREALRGRVVTDYFCEQCDRGWMEENVEQHAPGCLAAIDSAIEAEKGATDVRN